jgi:hypothetical protein
VMIVLIPTCERPILFARLIRQIVPDLGQRDRLIVHDDASTDPYVNRTLSASNLDCQYTILRSSPRSGKRGYWQTMGKLLAAAKDSSDNPNEPIYYLADDLVMASDWVSRSLALLDKYTSTTDRKPSWTRCLGVVMHTDFQNPNWAQPL